MNFHLARNPGCPRIGRRPLISGFGLAYRERLQVCSREEGLRVKRWAVGLSIAAVVGQFGCGSSDKSSPPGTDAAENDAAESDATSGNDGGQGSPEGSTSVSEAGGGDATIPTGSEAGSDGGGDATTTSSNDAGGDASEAAAPWSPSSLTGLALWLDGHEGLGMTDAGSDAGDGGPGVVWMDRSGNGNNAVGYGPAIGPTALDGQPAVHFDGTDYLLLQDSTSLNWGTNDFLLAVVVQHTTYESPDAGGSTYGALYSKQIYDTAPYQGVGLFANRPGGASNILEQLNEYGTTEVTSAGSGYNDGTPFLVVIHRSSIVLAVDGGADAGDAGASDAAPATTGTMAMLINAVDAGYATGSGYAENVDSTDYPARIGGTQAGQNIVGDIAEVVAVDGTISASDLQNLQTYLVNKYGL
jgi:hypothetical protein